MTVRAFVLKAAPTRPVRTGGLGRIVRAVANRLAKWRERSEQRTHLAGMNDRMLKDIGISRADAVREASKPCWRA